MLLLDDEIYFPRGQKKRQTLPFEEWKARWEISWDLVNVFAKHPKTTLATSYSKSYYVIETTTTAAGDIRHFLTISGLEISDDDLLAINLYATFLTTIILNDVI